MDCALHIRMGALVHGVAPRDAARWWSDFREGRADHAFLPNTRRRILRRDEGHVSMVEETKLLGLSVFRESTTAWPRETEVRFTGMNNFSSFEGRYAFEPAGADTRIVLDATIRLRRALRWSEIPAKPLVLAILRADLRGHAKDMQQDLNPGRQKTR